MGMSGIPCCVYDWPLLAHALWREVTGHGWIHERREGGFAFYQPAVYADQTKAKRKTMPLAG